nr:ABC transporter substrate-binding protein [Actinomycetales bacterium]
MRRVAALATAAVASLVLAACGGGASADGEYKIGISMILDHPSLNQARDGFKDALEEAGYEVTYDEQNAQGDSSVAASIAGNFAADGDMDMVLAVATTTAIAAAQAITDIPVLFTAVTDPAGSGLVESWEAPGGNVTGTSDKNPVKEQLELLLEIDPDVKTVGIVYSSKEENSYVQVEWAEEAAVELGLTIESVTIVEPGDIPNAAESLDVDAYYIPTDNVIVGAIDSIIGVAENRQVPVIVGEGDSVERGGIATYGMSYYELGLQTGAMAIRILEGADPATTPVETQSDLALYLNLGAAERMGVTIPQAMIDRAEPENIVE